MVSPGSIGSVLDNDETGNASEQAKCTCSKHHVSTTIRTQDSQAIEADAQCNQTRHEDRAGKSSASSTISKIVVFFHQASSILMNCT